MWLLKSEAESPSNSQDIYIKVHTRRVILQRITNILKD